jgi:N utilization substance protein A
MDINIIEVLDAMAASHKLTPQEMIQVLEIAIKEAWETVYGQGYKLSLEVINKDVALYREVEVVQEVTDIKTQIKGENVGHIIKDKLPLSNLPRNVVLNVYDALTREIKNIHKIREYDLYKDQVGKLFKYQVKKIAGRSIILNIANQYDGIIPASLANQRERFAIGEYIQCRLAEVNYNLMDYQLIFERKSKEFIEELVAESIPEVGAGAVRIKAVAREPGSLCKILVESEGSVNAVGACLGMKGQRRAEIVKELKGEKIDFIMYHQNIINQIKECFRSKKIDIFKINIIDDENIEIVIPDDKVPEAIGKRGQNIFLTKRLLNKQLTIISQTDHQTKEDARLLEAAKEFEQFEIDNTTAIEILTKYHTIQDAIYSEELEPDLVNKLENYLAYKQEQEKEEFINSGGDAEFFASIPNIPNFVYFDLLHSNIKNYDALLHFQTAEELSEYSGIDIDICIMLLEQNINNTI